MPTPKAKVTIYRVLLSFQLSIKQLKIVTLIISKRYKKIFNDYSEKQ